MVKTLLNTILLFCISTVTAQPVFEKLLLIDSLGSVSSHHQLDYDNDGDDDLLVFGARFDYLQVLSCSAQLKWWENDNNSLNHKGVSFCYNRPLHESKSHHVYQAKIFNGVKDELVVNTTGTYFDNNYRTYYYDSNTDSTFVNTFVIDPNLDFGDIYTKDYNFVDLNSDGYDDILKKHYSEDKYAYYINRKNGTFMRNGIFGNIPEVEYLEFELDSIVLPSTDFRFFDLNGDGTEDWVFTSNGDQYLYWMSNTGDTNFQNVQLLQSFNDSLAENWFRDIDLDGDLDLVANIKGEGLNYYSNDGAGNFSFDKEIYPSHSKLFEVADLDNDGYNDIVISPEELGIGDSITYKTIWLKNNSGLSYSEFLIDDIRISKCIFAYVNGDERIDIVDLSGPHELFYYANTAGLDTIPPSIVCKDSTVALEYGDSIIISASELIASATDNDIIEIIESSQTVFYALDVECYNVEITATDFSGNEAVCTAQVCIENPVTTVTEFIDYNISVYPNPTSSNIEISIGKKLAFKFDVTLVDVSGRVVKEIYNQDGRVVHLDCNNLSTGIYFLKLENSIDKSLIYSSSILVQ